MDDMMQFLFILLLSIGFVALVTLANETHTAYVVTRVFRLNEESIPRWEYVSFSYDRDTAMEKAISLNLENKCRVLHYTVTEVPVHNVFQPRINLFKEYDYRCSLIEEKGSDCRILM